MLDRSTYQRAFRREADTLRSAAQRGISAPVPSCPGWTVASIIAHLMGGVYARRLEAIRQRPSVPQTRDPHDLGLSESVTRWLATSSHDAATAPPDLRDYFTQVVGMVEAELYSLDPDEPLATWWPPMQNAAFFHRRLAHENAIHRWDVQLAHGITEPIEPELATDGIEEMFEVHLFDRHGEVQQAHPGRGETYHFHRTDGPGEWLLTFDPQGPVLRREHAKGDVALRGTASDLLLWLYHRVPADRLEVFGDQTLLTRYFTLVPPA
jgi:uncharacterized protein (TIGR03083 family)